VIVREAAKEIRASITDLAAGRKRLRKRTPADIHRLAAHSSEARRYTTEQRQLKWDPPNGLTPWKTSNIAPQSNVALAEVVGDGEFGLGRVFGNYWPHKPSAGVGRHKKDAAGPYIRLVISFFQWYLCEIPPSKQVISDCIRLPQIRLRRKAAGTSKN